jgi:hypothetical protein
MILKKHHHNCIIFNKGNTDYDTIGSIVSICGLDVRARTTRRPSDSQILL